MLASEFVPVVRSIRPISTLARFHKLISTPRSSVKVLTWTTEKQKSRLFRYSGSNLDRIRRNGERLTP